MATASLTLQVQSQGVDSATNELEDLENQANQTEIAVGQLETIQLRPSGISSTTDQFRNLENQVNEANTAVGQLETIQLRPSGISSTSDQFRNLENQANQTEIAVGQLNTASQQLSSSMQGLSGATSNLINFLPSLGTAFAIAAAGLLALLTNAGSFRSELVRLADLSNTSVPEFQKISSAFKTLNIDMDKAADILKDVNDKVGDFVLTGGGEFKTIFEKVIKPLGKTREELTKLGPEGILLLVAEGLEKIGANGQETTFILEALANDATLLVPLLENNGAALREISLAIEEKGLLLTEVEVEALRAVNKQLSEIEVTVTNIFTKTKGFLAAAFFPKKNVENVEELIETILALDAAAIRSEQLGGLLGKNKAARLRIEAKEARARLENIILTGIEEDKAAIEREKKEKERTRIGTERRAAELAAIRKVEQDKIEGKREVEERKVAIELERFVAKQMREQEQKEKELALEREFAQRRFQLILALNDTERDAIGRIRANRLKDLEVDLKKRLISSRDFTVARLEINRNAAIAEAELDEEAAKTKTQQTEKVISQITGLMQSGNRELFRIGQAAALANAVVETASAVSKALAAAAPPLSFLLATAAAAAGAAQIATIASASPPAERQQGGQFQAGQQLLVGEQGPELVEFGVGGRIASAQETKKITGTRPSTPEIVIINQTSEEITQPDVNVDEEQRIIILIRNTVSSDLENPNSRVSKSLNRNTTTSRQF